MEWILGVAGLVLLVGLLTWAARALDRASTGNAQRFRIFMPGKLGHYITVDLGMMRTSARIPAHGEVFHVDYALRREGPNRWSTRLLDASWPAVEIIVRQDWAEKGALMARASGFFDVEESLAARRAELEWHPMPPEAASMLEARWHRFTRS